MNRRRCECEKDIVAALRTGLWTEKLRGHVESCPWCGETRRVAESLLRYAASMHSEREPEVAGLIWRRAQAERKARILKRATRPLIFMRLLSMGCVLAFAAWLLHGVSRFDYREMMRGWSMSGGIGGSPVAASGGASGGASIWAGIAVLCIAAGALYLLHEGKRTRVFDASI